MYISISKQVLCTLFDGQNHLFQHFNMFFNLFSITKRKKKKRHTKFQTPPPKNWFLTYISKKNFAQRPLQYFICVQNRDSKCLKKNRGLLLTFLRRLSPMTLDAIPLMWQSSIILAQQVSLFCIGMNAKPTISRSQVGYLLMFLSKGRKFLQSVLLASLGLSYLEVQEGIKAKAWVLPLCAPWVCANSECTPYFLSKTFLCLHVYIESISVAWN